MLNIIKSSLNANMRGISLVSNNIANSNTTAFKKSYSNFSDIYSKNIGDNPKGFSGMGVINDSPRKQMFQGPLKQTNGALDLAVTGLGFFQVVNENAVDPPFFTRDGSFNITATGEVVTNDGLKVMGYLGQDNEILKNLVIPPRKTNEDQTISLISNINVNSKGKITATYGFDDEEIIGNFILASFPNETGLKQVGNNRYQINTKSDCQILAFQWRMHLVKLNLVI